MRRRFREIRNRELREVRKDDSQKPENNFRQIKPETNITKEEADAFWNMMFSDDIEPEERLETSAKVAEAVGVSTEHVLRTVEDVDNFFQN